MEKNKIKRNPKRAIYDKTEVYQILDNHFLCHIGFTHNNYPVVIPTMFGRKDDSIYIHGASVSRLIKDLEQGIDICVSVARVNGLVLARSAFHHSLNYESVVLFGKGKLIEEEDKSDALKVISDHLIKNRWEEVRLPNEKELKATKVIEIKIDELSAKVRKGDPVDDTEDLDMDVWAGVVPLKEYYDEPIPAPDMKGDFLVSESVQKLLNN